MKRALLICILTLSFCGSAWGQTHTATGTFTLSSDDTAAACAVTGANCSQNVYRASGACSASSVFVLNQALSATATTFTDSTIVPGTYCYAVSFVINGKESIIFTTGDTNFTTVSLQPKAQTGLVVVVN